MVECQANRYDHHLILDLRYQLLSCEESQAAVPQPTSSLTTALLDVSRWDRYIPLALKAPLSGSRAAIRAVDDIPHTSARSPDRQVSLAITVVVSGYGDVTQALGSPLCRSGAPV